MSDAPKTRVELLDRAIENLGVLVEGQSVTDAHRQKVDRVLDGHMAALRTEEIVYVPDYGTANPPAGGSIPAEYFLALADTLAWRVAPSFSLAGDPSLKSLDILARDELRRLTKTPRTRRALRCDPQTRGGRRSFNGNFTRGT